ncbi:hypothetical protein F0252_21590 [Vibrio hepatarius]|nr:hypothetical protein [Vibrio hepatarius]
MLKVSFVALFLQKVFLVLSVRFLRRCVFQVVSATNALKLRLIWFSNIRKASVGKAVINSKPKPWVWQLTKHLRGILNAWQFWFESALVFTAQWFSLGGMRCSPLNAALCKAGKIGIILSLAIGLHPRQNSLFLS